MGKYTDSLISTRYYRPYDANFFTVDNRPLVDINTNLGLINQGVDLLSNSSQFLPLIDSSTTAGFIIVDVTLGQNPGFILNVKVANSNSGTVSIITNGSTLGTPSSVNMNGSPLTGGELIAGNWYFLLFDGLYYNVIAGTAGTVSAGAAVASGQAVTQQSLLNGEYANVASLVTPSLTVSASSNMTGTISSTSTATGGTLGVQYQQLEEGMAYSLSVVDWTSVLMDTPLNVGQSASYFINGQVGYVPLHIACRAGEIYEVSLIEFNGTSSGYDIVLLPNNTGYAGQFYTGGFEASSFNSNSYFTASSSTPSYSIQPSPFFQVSGSPNGAGFYFDDIGGSVVAPYLRVLRVFTGGITTPALGLNISGGGVYQAASSTGTGMGTNLSVSVWDNTSISYTSLGTLAIGPSAEWQILVRRIS